MKQNRNAGLDLLRIVSMLMVVCLHFFSHGGLMLGTFERGTPNWYIGNMMYVLCYVCVNCFVLLSGYFQCESSFKLKRVISVWLQAAFYSVGLYLICAIAQGDFSLSGALKSGLVVTMEAYWFVTSYFIMYVLSPFLNCAIAQMSKRMHLLCCCVLIGIFSVLANIFYVNDFAYLHGGYSPIWFCTLYMVAAYIRKHVPVKHKHRVPALAVYLLCASAIAVERFAATAITPMLLGSLKLYSLFFSYNSIMAAVASIALLLFFRTVEVKKPAAVKIIGFFAPLAFGVYLIHDHNSIRPLLWQWLNPAAFADSPWMVAYVTGCMLAIFSACCLIEWLRQQLFRLCKINQLVGSLCGKIQDRVERWLNAPA